MQAEFRSMTKKGILILFSALLLTACGEYQQLLKSKDPELKYQQALVYFNAEQYVKAQTLRRKATNMYGAYLDATEHTSKSTHLRMIASTDTGFIADTIAQNSGIDFPDKAKLLCMANPVRRLETVLRMLQREIQAQIDITKTDAVCV